MTMINSQKSPRWSTFTESANASLLSQKFVVPLQGDVVLDLQEVSTLVGAHVFGISGPFLPCEISGAFLASTTSFTTTDVELRPGLPVMTESAFASVVTDARAVPPSIIDIKTAMPPITGVVHLTKRSSLVFYRLATITNGASHGLNHLSHLQ